MSPGALLAATILALFGATGTWIGRTRHPVPHRGRLVALFWGLGVTLAAFGWWSDVGLRRVTLFEVIAEGSRGAPVGGEAPVRAFEFEVLHAGVEHDLRVYPEYEQLALRWSDFDAEVHARVLDADGRVLVEGSHMHRPIFEDRSWRDQRYVFTPERAGPHTLVIIPITVGIPTVHARIVDPLGVPDDRRLPGY